MTLVRVKAEELVAGDIFHTLYDEGDPNYPWHDDALLEDALLFTQLDAVVRVFDLLMAAVTNVRTGERLNVDISSQMPVLVKRT